MSILRPSVLLLILIGLTSQTAPPALPPVFTSLGVADAWRVSRGAGVSVGIVDVGFDFEHPALETALEPGFFAPGVYHSSASVIVAHGTAIASVIGARPAPGAEIVGLAPEARMIAAARGMPAHTLAQLQRQLGLAGRPIEEVAAALRPHLDEIKAFQSRWIRHVADSTAAAIEYLVDRQVAVINISENLPLDAFAALPDQAAPLQRAFETAAARDVVIVLAAGNAGTRVEHYPGDPRFVAVVGAATAGDTRWRQPSPRPGLPAQGSSVGPRLTVLAPMEHFAVARPHDPALYRLLHSPMGPIDEPFEGAVAAQPLGATSVAAAVVTGLVALVRSADRSLTAGQVISLIGRAAKDLGAPGRDDESGFGRVDFGGTLALVARKDGGR